MPKMQTIRLPQALADALSETGRTLALAVVKVEDNGLMVIVQPNAFEAPAVWGIVIADLVGHVANAYADRYSPVQTADVIWEMVVAERDDPTDKAHPFHRGGN